MLVDASVGSVAGAKDSVDLTLGSESNRDFLINPGVGFEAWEVTRWGDPPYGENHYSLVYYRFYWSEIELSPGAFDWSLLDEALNDALKRKKKVGLRIMAVGGDAVGTYKGRSGKMAVPEWVAGRIGGSWIRTRDEDQIFWPDYNSSGFLIEVERVLAALSSRYGQLGVINHLDLSFFGCWGEMNDECTGRRVEESDWWEIDSFAQVVALHRAYFPKVPLLVPAQSDEKYDFVFESPGVGWRVDCFGDYGLFSKNWNHMDDYYPSFVNRNKNVWKKGMVALEICGTIDDWQNLGFDFGKAMSKALEWHASTINFKSGEFPEAWIPKLRETHRKLGYRLRLAEANLPLLIDKGQRLSLKLSLINEGVAPPYHDYEALFRFESEDSQHDFIVPLLNMQSVIPGEHLISLEAETTELERRTYMVSLGIFRSGDRNSQVSLGGPFDSAVDGSGLRFVQIGSVEVK